MYSYRTSSYDRPIRESPYYGRGHPDRGDGASHSSIGYGTSRNYSAPTRPGTEEDQWYLRHATDHHGTDYGSGSDPYQKPREPPLREPTRGGSSFDKAAVEARVAQFQLETGRLHSKTGATERGARTRRTMPVLSTMVIPKPLVNAKFNLKTRASVQASRSAFHSATSGMESTSQGEGQIKLDLAQYSGADPFAVSSLGDTVAGAISREQFDKYTSDIIVDLAKSDLAKSHMAVLPSRPPNRHPAQTAPDLDPGSGAPEAKVDNVNTPAPPGTPKTKIGASPGTPKTTIKEPPDTPVTTIGNVADALSDLQEDDRSDDRSSGQVHHPPPPHPPDESDSQGLPSDLTITEFVRYTMTYGEMPTVTGLSKYQVDVCSACIMDTQADISMTYADGGVDDAMIWEETGAYKIQEMNYGAFHEHLHYLDEDWHRAGSGPNGHTQKMRILERAAALKDCKILLVAGVRGAILAASNEVNALITACVDSSTSREVADVIWTSKYRTEIESGPLAATLGVAATNFSIWSDIAHGHSGDSSRESSLLQVREYQQSEPEADQSNRTFVIDVFNKYKNIIKQESQQSYENRLLHEGGSNYLHPARVVLSAWRKDRSVGGNPYFHTHIHAAELECDDIDKSGCPVEHRISYSRSVIIRAAALMDRIAVETPALAPSPAEAQNVWRDHKKGTANVNKWRG